MTSDYSSFSKLINKFLVDFEPFESEFFLRRRSEIRKYPKLISDFYRDLEDISGGGKRMRAFLVYLGYLIGGGKDIESILPIALAVEVIHTFLLIHDDIIDKSDTRRGKMTVHKRYEKVFGAHYGMSQAIVLGDIAGFEALKLVNSSGFSDRQKIECQKKLYDVILETAYGEALDVLYSYKGAKIADIMAVSDLKTAKYSFVGPLSIGIALGKHSKKQLVAVEKFGQLVGTVFQLQDDYLGVFGNEKVLGKSTLSDMREGKNTLIIHKAKQLATPKGLAEINKIWGNPKSGGRELKKIRDIVRKCGALAWCEDENKRLMVVAKKEIGKITRELKLQQILSQVADYVVSRER
jgi:geranylgeranyl pyrophosphate synthase